MDAVDGYIVCCRLATGCMLLTGANTRGSEWRCFVKKDVLKNFAKLPGKHLCQSLFFNKFAGLRQLFSQKNSGRLLLKCGHCQNEAREIDCFVAEGWMQYLLLRLKSQCAREACYHLACLGICPTISQTCQPYLTSR